MYDKSVSTINMQHLSTILFLQYLSAILTYQNLNVLLISARLFYYKKMFLASSNKFPVSLRRQTTDISTPEIEIEMNFLQKLLENYSILLYTRILTLTKILTTGLIEKSDKIFKCLCTAGKYLTRSLNISLIVSRRRPIQGSYTSFLGFLG